MEKVSVNYSIQNSGQKLEVNSVKEMCLCNVSACVYVCVLIFVP